MLSAASLSGFAKGDHSTKFCDIGLLGSEPNLVKHIKILGDFLAEKLNSYKLLILGQFLT